MRQSLNWQCLRKWPTGVEVQRTQSRRSEQQENAKQWRSDSTSTVGRGSDVIVCFPSWDVCIMSYHRCGSSSEVAPRLHERRAAICGVPASADVLGRTCTRCWWGSSISEDADADSREEEPRGAGMLWMERWETYVLSFAAPILS